jgi:hypothetical protein
MAQTIPFLPTLVEFTHGLVNIPPPVGTLTT